MDKDWPARLTLRACRAWWSEAVKSSRTQRKAVLEALEALVPPEEYAAHLAGLLKSRDQRVRARALELIAKLQGVIADQGSDGHRVVVAFGSVLTGQQVDKHQGLSGRQDDKPPEELGSG